MRWNEPKIYEIGDKRVRSFFAWLPVFIHGTRKNVWLERVTVEEQLGLAGITTLKLVWRALREIDGKQDYAQ